MEPCSASLSLAPIAQSTGGDCGGLCHPMGNSFPGTCTKMLGLRLECDWSLSIDWNYDAMYKYIYMIHYDTMYYVYYICILYIYYIYILYIYILYIYCIHFYFPPNGFKQNMWHQFIPTIACSMDFECLAAPTEFPNNKVFECLRATNKLYYCSVFMPQGQPLYFTIAWFRTDIEIASGHPWNLWILNASGHTWNS